MLVQVGVNEGEREREREWLFAVGQTGDEGSRLEPELLQVAEVLVAGKWKQQCNYRHKASIWNSRSSRSSSSTASGRQRKTLARRVLPIAVAACWHYCSARLTVVGRGLIP